MASRVQCGNSNTFDGQDNEEESDSIRRARDREGVSHFLAQVLLYIPLSILADVLLVVLGIMYFCLGTLAN